jgi:hypothetical protein
LGGQGSGSLILDAETRAKFCVRIHVFELWECASLGDCSYCEFLVDCLETLGISPEGGPEILSAVAIPGLPIYLSYDQPGKGRQVMEVYAQAGEARSIILNFIIAPLRGFTLTLYIIIPLQTLKVRLKLKAWLNALSLRIPHIQTLLSQEFVTGSTFAIRNIPNADTHPPHRLVDSWTLVFPLHHGVKEKYVSWKTSRPR